MKKLFLVFLLVVAVVTASSSTGTSEGTPTTKVIAYYFHGTFRCLTCHKLEQYAKEVIETDFKDALASGELEFRVINVEDKGKGHYTKDYQLYTKSIVLSSVKNGTETKWKNLDKIWEYVANKQKYCDYLKNEITAFLEETP